MNKPVYLWGYHIYIYTPFRSHFGSRAGPQHLCCTFNLDFGIVIGLAPFSRSFSWLLCMSAWWLFFLVYSFVIFSVEGDGNSNSASSTAEVPSQGTSCLARPSQRPDSAEFCKTQESSWNTAVPSLQGLWLPLQDPSRDDELTGIWVALWLLQENALAERLVLRPVWSELGELCSPYGQAGWTESRPVEFLADCEHCFEDEEPKAAETVVKEEKQMERFGTAIKFACRAILAWKCNSMASDAADVLSNASWMGSQRAWKRNSTELSAASNACTSTIAAATAYMSGYPSPQGVPWLHQHMPAMPSMHFLPQQSEADAMEEAEERKAALSAQQKLNKIVKAAKKEDNLSSEFQSLVHAEMKKDDKESTNNLLAAVRANGKAKEALLEVESSRVQLWSQWKVFLQQSVVKWKEYTSQFQASEAAFQSKMQEATLHLRRTQRRVDIAKKRADAMNKDEDISLITEDEMEDSEAREEEEIPRDENAQKIQEGLNTVVSSLTELSDSADKLEPKPKDLVQGTTRTQETQRLVGDSPLCSLFARPTERDLYVRPSMAGASTLPFCSGFTLEPFNSQ